jgi:hypothetical protein
MKSRVLQAGLVIAFIVVVMPLTALAQFNSPNYEINEVFIGGGGELDACSTAFCADQSAGGTAVGDTESTNFRAQGGFGTPSEPTLEMNVSGTSINLGTLTTSSTAAASANFSVKNYLSNGYVVRVYGNPPTNSTGVSGVPIAAMAVPATSSPGTAQFGVNLVSNTVPGIGANPSQAPDATFSFGQAATDYNTPNNFKFVSGDVIALSAEETGQTDYTMSMIANISTLSPGGEYRTTIVVQAIASF